MGSQRRSTPVKVAHALDESTRRALMAMAGTPEPKSADSKVPPRSAPKRSPRQHSSPAVSVETLAAQAGPAAASKSAAAAQRMVAAARRRRATAPQAATNAAAAVAPTIAAPVAAENPRSARPPKKSSTRSGSASVTPSSTTQSVRRTADASSRSETLPATHDQTASKQEPREIPKHRHLLPAWVKRLPTALQYDPSHFRQAVKEMSEQEREALRSEIRRELRLIQHGRLSAEASADASRQARFLLATLSGKVVPLSRARKRPPKLVSTSKPQKHTQDDPEASVTPRLRSVRTYKPSPSKYLLPAYGAPVSGGLPSLGSRS